MSDHKVTHVYVKRIKSTLSIKPVLKMHVHVVHVFFQHTIEKLFRKNKLTIGPKDKPWFDSALRNEITGIIRKIF